MKNKLKYKVLICMGLLCLMACSNSTSSKENLIIGYDNTFVPMGFLTETGEIDGFDVDLAIEVFNRLGLAYEFQSINWSMKETELNANNIDLIWNGYSLTEERKRQVSYTEPYLQNKQVIITLANGRINSLEDLTGKTLATQQGSASFEAIEKNKTLLSSIKGQAPLLYETFDQAFRDLSIGRVDAIVADEVLARYYLNQKSTDGYSILDEDLGEEVFVVACRQTDSELCSRINESLIQIKADGTFNQIYNKWFSN